MGISRDERQGRPSGRFLVFALFALVALGVAGVCSAQGTVSRARLASKKKGGVVSTIFVNWTHSGQIYGRGGNPRAVVATGRHVPRRINKSHHVERNLRFVFSAAPNGRLIEDNSGIARSDGTHRQVLLFPGSEGIPPRFGSSSSLVWDDLVQPSGGILTRSIRGSGTRTIYSNPMAGVGHGVEAADGRRVAFSMSAAGPVPGVPGTGNGLYAINSDGTGLRQLFQQRSFTDPFGDIVPGALEAATGISLDGTQVLFEPQIDPQGDFDVDLINWDGSGGPRTLIADIDPTGADSTAPDTNSAIIFSPNGRELAYRDATARTITIIGTDGSFHRTISCGGGGLCDPVAWVNVPASLAKGWAKK
jgi:hypothetical protein